MVFKNQFGKIKKDKTMTKLAMAFPKNEATP